MLFGVRMIKMLAVASLAGLALSGCSGEPTPSAPTVTTSSSGSQWSPQLAEIKTQLTSLQDSTTPKAAESRTEQMISLEKILTSMATDAGAQGLGPIACEVMPIQLLSYSDGSLPPEAVGMQLGAYWSAPVVAAAGKSEVTYEEIGLDSQVKDACPDVHGQVLEATGLASLDDLYFVTR